MEVPQRDGGRHLDLTRLGVHASGRQADGGRGLEVPEDGDAGLGIDGGGVGCACGGGTTAAHAEELDLRHDEAVAAAVFAHHAVEVCETLQVENLLWGALTAHPRVPLVVALDEADDAAAGVAVDGLLVVGGVAGDEVGLGTHARVGLEGTHHHVGGALGDLEGSVDLGGVVVRVDVVEGGLVLWLESLAAGLGEERRGDWDFEEGEDRWEGSDGGDVEVGPGAEVADVPPEVGVCAAGDAGNAVDEGRRGVGRRQVLQEGRGGQLGEAVEADLGIEGVLHSWSGIKVGEGVVMGGGGSVSNLLGLTVGRSWHGSDHHWLSGAGSGHIRGEVAVRGKAEASNDRLVDASSRASACMSRNGSRRARAAVSGVGSPTRLLGESNGRIKSRGSEAKVVGSRRDGRTNAAGSVVVERAGSTSDHGAWARVRAVCGTVAHAARGRRRPAMSNGTTSGLGNLVLCPDLWEEEGAMLSHW